MFRMNGTHARRQLARAAVAAGAVAALVAGCSASTTRPATSGRASGTPPALVEPTLTPVVGSVLYAPVPFIGEDGRTHLVYELLLTNYTPSPITLRSIDVRDAITDRSVYRISGADLAARVLPTGGKSYEATFGGGKAAAVFLHVTLAPGAPVPTSLVHELTASSGKASLSEQLAPTKVNKRTLPVLGPPLRGSGYLAADGCCDAVRHTRALLPLNGAPRLAQRYAIDYEQVDANGRIYVGKKTDPKSYTIFGKQVLAVADATVVATHDGLPEQVPGTFPKDLPIADADGNFVVLDLGNGFFANYAHMQPGSVRVKPGDHVHKGDVLGLVGNTGNLVAPHLHFHVMDASSPLVSEGLPYVIDSFTTTGRAASTADFDRAEADGTPLVTVPDVRPSQHRDQLVLDQSIVTFGG